MKSRTLLLLASLVMVAVSVHAQKIAVTKGQKLESVTTSKMVMTMEMMGQNVDNNTESTTTAEVEVKEVNGDGFLFGNTIKRMIIKASYMGQDMNFNSDKKEDMEGQMGQMLKDKIGKTEDVSVDKRGKVIEMKGDTAKAAGSMGDMMNMASQLAKGQAYPLLAQLPTAKIKAGDSWTDSTGSPETIKTVTTYTLKEIKGDSMLVSYTGTIAKSGTIQQNGMEIQIEMGGTVKGNAAYETASGLLKSNNAVSDIKGSFQVMGQSVPMTVSITANTIARKL